MKLYGLRASVVGLVAGIFAFAVTAADAHVRVKPAESKVGVTESYQVTVPTEGKSSTVRVELVVPAGVELVSVADAEDPHEVRKGEAGTSVITWRGEILPGFARQYAFTARNPKIGSEISWVAHQYFADGTVADWADVPGSKRPASVTKLGAAP
ncbi:MAG TPA: DUF1775 domain-containing protein [Bryobacteraceae bacterium]